MARGIDRKVDLIIEKVQGLEVSMGQIQEHMKNSDEKFITLSGNDKTHTEDITAIKADQSKLVGQISVWATVLAIIISGIVSIALSVFKR